MADIIRTVIIIVLNISNHCYVSFEVEIIPENVNIKNICNPSEGDMISVEMLSRLISDPLS